MAFSLAIKYLYMNARLHVSFEEGYIHSSFLSFVHQADYFHNQTPQLQALFLLHYTFILQCYLYTPLLPNPYALLYMDFQIQQNVMVCLYLQNYLAQSVHHRQW